MKKNTVVNCKFDQNIRIEEEIEEEAFLGKKHREECNLVFNFGVLIIRSRKFDNFRALFFANSKTKFRKINYRYQCKYDTKEIREKLAKFMYYNQKDESFYKSLRRFSYTFYTEYINNEFSLTDRLSFKEKEKEYFKNLKK